ncbi:MAG: UDP-N-acetylmuramate dehydrogenase [Coxiellaceae bacterium]|jgi:UDP-N-acetylmuramate dehydrogenase|nr:UDP-N-acetylmuramate dehydrogenase [Coxiellaceae bacterium]
MKGKLKHHHLLAKYTSWKIGGPAEYFYRPTDLEDLTELLQTWEKEPITILGAATNVLIRDGGIKGLVIYLRNSLNDIEIIDGSNLWVEAGLSLSHLVKKCADLGMRDAAFLVGIPGTIGGALKMNTGAYGDYIWNHVQMVETINRQGKTKIRRANEFKAEYREVHSLAQDEWFTAAQLTFTKSKIETTKQQIDIYLQKRKSSHPLDLPSCGSVFRNPQGDYAARLIEICGLKGKRIGGAQVSEKHANFISNCGNATATDVETLIQEIIITVQKSIGIKLIPEIDILGEK